MSNENKEIKEAGKEEAKTAKAEGRKAAKEAKFIVKKTFQDIKDLYKTHRAGDDVSDMDPERLNYLEDLGLVEQK